MFIVGPVSVQCTDYMAIILLKSATSSSHPTPRSMIGTTAVDAQGTTQMHKESMIDRLSNLINCNRSAAKISQV